MRGKTALRLAEHGISSVGMLKALPETDALCMMQISGLGKINGLKTLADTCLNENAPPILDHRQHANPYESKFGQDWRTAIKTSVTLSGCICVTELIEKMVSEGAAVMKGTKHKADWVFYHNALSLLVAKDTVQWMKEQGIYNW